MASDVIKEMTINGGDLRESRRKSNLFPKALSLTCFLGYPIIFAAIYPATIEVILCSLLHALCALLVMHRVVSKVLIKQASHISMATMFILINLLYFGASSIKYFESELYPGFVDNAGLRLIYSLLALVVLWISFEIINRLKSGHRNIYYTGKNFVILKVLTSLILLFICTNVISNYQEKGFGYAYVLDSNSTQLAWDRVNLATIEKIGTWVLNSTNVVLVLLIALLQREKSNRIYLIISIIVCFISSLFSGSRSLLFYFVMGMAFAIPYLYGAGRKLFSNILLASPLLLAAGSLLILIVTGRVAFDDRESLKFQLAYRFDLSDYAATLVLSNKAVVFNYAAITDAVYYSVPQALFPEKYVANKNSALQRLYEASLDEYTDYTDSFFSIGAGIGGFIGFMMFPAFMVFLLHWMEQLLYRKMFGYSYFITILMFPLFLRVETDLNNLFADWRMMPVYFVYAIVLRMCFVKHIYIIPSNQGAYLKP
jgi:hypothetical protein